MVKSEIGSALHVRRSLQHDQKLKQTGKNTSEPGETRGILFHEGLCLHIMHSTSSTPDPEISNSLTEEKLDDLAVSDSTAYIIERPGVRHG